MRKSFRYRMYPNAKAQESLLWTLRRCREVHNAAITERREAYHLGVRQHPNFYDPQVREQLQKEHRISLYDQQNELSPMKDIREEYKSLTAAHILNEVCRRVDGAFNNFFERQKKGLKGGYPRMKSQSRYTSFTYPDKPYRPGKATGWELKITGKKRARLILTNIGDIPLRFHRPIEGIIKTCTVKKDGEQWYVSFSCEVDEQPLPLSYEDTGIDVGIESFVTLSNGGKVDNPRYYRKAEEKLARHQQALAHKRNYESKRRKRAVKRVARVHQKTRNQRRDFLHKVSRDIVNTYQFIAFEDLNVMGLMHTPKPKQDEETGKYLPNGAAAKAGLNKSIADAGWGKFMQYCTYKAEWAGRTVAKVHPEYTSQLCSECGTLVHKSLSTRTHMCPLCGLVLDRDHNAAINILTRGREAQSTDNAKHGASQKKRQTARVAPKTGATPSEPPGSTSMPPCSSNRVRGQPRKRPRKEAS